ncbi:hypothetical protein Sste5346_009383 [Sporothrix stenoceras]|uniref:Uncharacterized protein n=1 Tax=Sporothrix stenoceras TaxID=5173 RepID=A0ABR3YKH8_9PEZI
MNAMQHAHTGRIWSPGFMRQVPWGAFICIAAFMICCIGIGVTLASSQGKAVASWPTESHPFSVSVLLSLLVSIANVCLAGALGKAYEIAWWLKAIHGSDLRRLKYNLNVQSNYAVFFSRAFTLNRFTIAAFVALAVSVLDGPLIQKASTIDSKTSGPFASNVTATILDGFLPVDYSGYGVGPDLLSPGFSNVSLQYNNRDPIKMAIDGCDNANTTCTLDFPGLGFDINCTETTVAYNFGNLVSGSTKNNNVTTFQVTTAYGQNQNLAEFIAIRTSATYKPDAACKGDLVKRTCSLHLSTVKYPLTVVGGVATLGAWDEKRNDTIAWASINSTQAYGTLFTGSFAAGGFQTMLGGIYLALNNLYAGNANLRIATMTETPYVLAATGNSASNYLTSDLSTYSNCTMTWSDPTADYVNTARELMLRSVVSYASQNPKKTSATQLVAQRTTVAATYESAYKFLAAAMASMALEMLLIMFLLYGWQHLGRHVSLDAFEIARAMGAPLLQHGSSNTEIDESLVPIERTKLKYGEILPSQPPQQYGNSMADNNLYPGSASQDTNNSPVQMEQTAFGIKTGYAMVNVNDEQQPLVRRLGLVEAERSGRIEHGVLY